MGTWRQDLIQVASSRPSLVLLATLAALWTAKAAAPFLAPLTLAMFILAFAWPVQSFLQERVPKIIALVLTLALVLGVMLVLGLLALWAFGAVWQAISSNAARYQLLYQSAADWLEGHGIVMAGIWADNINVNWLLRMTQQIVSRMSQTMSFWIVAIAYLVTGLVEVERVKHNVRGLSDPAVSEIIIGGFGETARKLRRYMWVRTVISMFTGVAIGVFALATQIPFAVEWGVIGFALNFIPFIGPLIATTLPSLFVLAHLGDPGFALMVFACLSIVQFLSGNYIEPRVSGDALQLSPFVILVAIFLWTFIWGIYGTFIGVPIAIAVAAFTSRAPAMRWLSQLMGGGEALEKRPGA